MSNICSVCGFHCDETATFCPTCGSPVTVAPQPTIQETVQPTPQPQVQQPIQPTPQPYMQQQVQPTPQPYMQQQVQPTPQPYMQQQVQPTPQPYMQQPVQPTPQPYMQQQVQPIPQPYMQQQDYQPTEPPKKKKLTWLWILLGVFGGLFLLGIIAAVATVILYPLLYTNSNVGGNSLPQYIGSGSNGNYQEYYYPEFENASFNSEAFVDVTTEAPTEASTEASTEAPSTSLNKGAEYRPEDSTYLTFTSDTPTPTSNNVNDNSVIVYDSGVSCTMPGKIPVFESTTDTLDYSYQTGRGITYGASLDTYIETYGIDDTNAIWETYSNGQTEYFYYSPTARPENMNDAMLVFGWYQKGTSWIRMTPEELHAFRKDVTTPGRYVLLIYMAYLDENGNIEAIHMIQDSHSAFRVYNNELMQVTDLLNNYLAE